MKTIQDIKIYKNKVFLVRADFNVPIKDNKIYDTFRVDQTFKTIDFLVKKGGIVNIVAHIGDDEKGSLFLIFSYLKKKYKKDISFFSGLINESTVSTINSERKTKIVLIENLRKNKGEKENIKSFSKTLSKLGDFYINDAFSVSHRKHASILGVTKYIPSFAGFQLQEEVKQLSKVFKPEHPFLFILGGNKFSTKLPLIKRYYDISDSIFLGGALLNDVLMSLDFQVGYSLVEGDKKYKKDLNKISLSKKFIFPTDLVVKRGQNNLNILTEDVLEKDYIYDIGIQTTKDLISKIKESKMILWNGPLGKYTDGFDRASKKVLKELSVSSKEVIIGGGDTVALLTKMKLQKKFSFVSTGGGATLLFLTYKTLPGIEALKKK